MNSLLERTFDEPIDRDEFNQYILDFISYENLLDKRITNIFKLSPWLYNFTTKEDLRQDVILNMFNAISGKFPTLDGVGKVKYFNACVKNTLAKHIRELQNNSYPVLDDNLDSVPLFEEEVGTTNLIYDLFLNETLEYQLVKLIEEGYKDEDIVKMLDIGRMTFYRIKKRVREKLKENGYR